MIKDPESGSKAAARESLSRDADPCVAPRRSVASTRARLTVSYAFVLLGTMVAFATSVWIGAAERVVEQIGQELGPYAFRIADRSC